jgi:uncharacterized repeat protein (TIGR03837 family)
MSVAPPLRWDIFCRVVDNFGDAGVCWRLARQLAAEHGQTVRLFCDQLGVLTQLAPDIDPTLRAQQSSGVTVLPWPQGDSEGVADVVIESFACDLPADYIEAMAARHPPPVWLNLEYLSAEPWVAGCHALPSPHPRLPLVKYFFFPGFVAGTGGLLREADLLPRRAACVAESQARWTALGLPPTMPDEIRVSLFCYENPALDGLLAAWSAGPAQVRCIVRPGRSLDQIASITGARGLKPGDRWSRDRLTVDILPFCPQPEFDTLLWLCDLNFARGEDSFVRAQWAGRPFVWHIYPQADDAHQVKLDAFLDLYCAALPGRAADACRGFWKDWNRGVAPDWTEYWQHRSDYAQQAQRWSDMLAQAPDLARNLVEFVRSRLK